MDPVTIISLVATCAGLAARMVATATSIDEFLQNYRGIDRSVASLVSKLRLFGETLTQLRLWLQQEPSVSNNLRRTIKSSVDNCSVVLEDLEEHVTKVLRLFRGGSRAGWTFGRKIKYIWSASFIAKHEERLSSQLQTVMLLINFVKLYDGPLVSPTSTSGFYLC